MSNDIQTIDRPQHWISLIEDNSIHVNRVNPTITSELVRLGTVERSSDGQERWILRPSGDQELADVLERLRDMGFMFLGGPAG